MKKILFVTLLLVTIVLFSLDSSSELPRDANSEPIQSGRCIQLYDATATAITSPVTSTTGSDTTLVIPTNAIELIINPNGGTLKYESYADTTRYFEFDAVHPFPCNGIDSLRISNDSGSSVTWSFYFSTI